MAPIWNSESGPDTKDVAILLQQKWNPVEAECLDTYGLMELCVQLATTLFSTKEKQQLFFCRHFLSKEVFKCHKEREEIFHSENGEVHVRRAP